MKKIIKNIIALSCFIIVGLTTINAQQIPIFNQYIYQQEMFNPAAIGGETGWEAFLNYRNQFQELDEGNPVSQVISLSGSPFKKSNNMGLGLFLENDQTTSSVRHIRAHLQYAYHLLLTPEHDFSLGLAGGISNRQINVQKMNVSDPAQYWLGENNSFMVFDAGFGFNYKYTSDAVVFKLGTAVQQLPNLLKDMKSFEDVAPDAGYDLNSHILSNLSVRYNAGNIGIEPGVFFASALDKTGGGDIDLRVKLSYMGLDRTDKVWLAGGMRTNNAGFHLALGVIPQRNINIFTSYELHNTLGSTFEVGVGFIFGRPQTAEELEAKQKRKDELALLEKQKKEEAGKKKELQEQERLEKERERKEEDARKAAIKEQEAIAEAKRRAQEDAVKAKEEEAAKKAKEIEDSKKLAEKERIRKEKEAAEAKAKKEADAKNSAVAKAKEKEEAAKLAAKEKEEEAKRAAKEKEEEAKRLAAEKAAEEKAAKEAAEKADPCSNVKTNVPNWIRPNGLQELLEKRNTSNDLAKATYKSSSSMVNITYIYSDESDKYQIDNNMRKWVTEMTDVVIDAIDQCKTPRLEDDINSVLIRSELLDSKDDLGFDAETGYDGEFGATLNVSYKSDGEITNKQISTGSISNEDLAIIKLISVRDALIKSLSDQGLSIPKSAFVLELISGMEDNDYLRTTNVTINIEKAQN